MNKAELINAISHETEHSKADTERFLEAFQNVVIKTVVDNDSVKLSGFASFDPVVRAARKMKNPRTGEDIQVPESKSVRIRPLKRFRDELKDN